jgi:hypothetical protein
MIQRVRDAGCRQVFGLAGSETFLLAVASQFAARTSALLRRSFLLTAAGQFRTLTGFPYR